ncbi:MAG TPA: response regulator [Alphaproteobacteria bacterium]|nr:response regulator [Alphaproteobacteria bacterium]
MRDRTVFIVDDDEAVRQALGFLLRTAGYSVECLTSAEEFLRRYNPRCPGCLILDIRMPDMTGLELQQALNARSWRIPVILVTGHGTVPVAIAALRAGAFEFLEKPLEEDALLDSVKRALNEDAAIRRQAAARGELAARAARLTPREREIMRLVAMGEQNKMIARRLGISFRTVEIHRTRVMEKMQARSLSDLVRMVIALDESASS